MKRKTMKVGFITLLVVLVLPDMASLYVLDKVVDIAKMVDNFTHRLLRGRELVGDAYAYEADHPQEPDVRRNVSEMITSKGYQVEEYTVKTPDGYLLGIQRIPRGREFSNDLKERPAILLAHGLFSSSAQWVLDFPNQSPAYILADAGYDVWMTNFRGNVYSKRHVKYNPKQWEFWNYSWDDMALIDLPTSIDFVRKTTGQDQIFYGGHSMGTTTIFALLSSVPEYNDKVKAVIALAPVANLTHVIGPLRLLAPFAHDVKFLIDLFTDNEFFPSDKLIGLFADVVCGPETPKAICESIAFMVVGPDVHLNASRIDVYLNHFPAGVSAKTIIHYAQCIEDRQFQKFDYGREANIEIYGQDRPPIYDVTKITVPVGLYSSRADYLADPRDVADLAAQIPNLLEWYKVPCFYWSHFDYVVGVDSYKCLYGKIIETLNSLK